MDQPRVEVITEIVNAAMDGISLNVKEFTPQELVSAFFTLTGNGMDFVLTHSPVDALAGNKMSLRIGVMGLETKLNPPLRAN